MTRYSRSFDVPNRLPETFAFIRAFEHAGLWDPAVQEARRLDPGPVRIGTRFLLVTRNPTRHMRYQVTDLEPERLLALEGQNDTLAWRDEIRFEALEAGTRITYDASICFKGLRGVAQPALSLLLKVYGDRAIDGIRTQLVQRWNARRSLEPAPMPAPASRVTPDDVQRIVAMSDQPVVRNLLITQGYADLSAQLARLVGGGNANWCTFGAWASRTAGRFVRNEEVPALLRGVLASDGQVQQRRQGLARALGTDPGADPVLAMADRLVDHVSEYIMAGNLTVFAELAHAFASYLQMAEALTSADDARLEAFLATLSDGPPMPDAESRDAGGRLVCSPRGGQSRLKECIRLYHQARFEPSLPRKAQLVLLANACGGIHEQTRLQTYIKGSLDAPVDDTLQATMTPANTGRPREELAHWLEPLTGAVKGAWERAMTLLAMELKLPDGVVYLGLDVSRAPGEPLFPDALVQLTEPELVKVMELYGALQPDTRRMGLFERGEATLEKALTHLGVAPYDAIGTATPDWAVLPERMRYILTLFRSRQQDPHLFTAPFTPAQVESARSGVVPPGPLY